MGGNYPAARRELRRVDLGVASASRGLQACKGRGIGVKAGRELDVEIELRVFGLEPAWYAGKEIYSSQAVAETYAVSNDVHWGRVQPKPYSVSIEQAWVVVLKLIADGWLPELEYSSKRGGYWDVCLGHMSLDAIYERGTTLPHAICLAALKAVPPSPGETKREEQ